MILHWEPLELCQVDDLIAQIEATAKPRCTASPGAIVTLKASEGHKLRSGLCSGGRFWRGLPVRHLLQALGFDEQRLFRWRPEHKLIQALIFHRYCGDAVPATRGLDGLLASGRDGAWRDELSSSEAAPEVVLKSATGYGGPLERSIESDRAILAAAGDRLRSGDQARTVDAEMFVVQMRVPLDGEFRVHTLEGHVVDGLTFRRGGSTEKPDQTAADDFVRKMLALLPNGLVADTLCGWDVMRTPSGAWRVIEVNQSGQHTLFDPGFQCSGYFSDPNWGFAMTARLLEFVERAYSVQIDVVADACPDGQLTTLYWWLARVLDFLRHRSKLIDLTRMVTEAPMPVVQESGPSSVPEGVLGIRSYAAELERFLSRFGMA